MTAVNQKEYLKKYLGLGKSTGEKKKKKKKDKITGNRLKIIDDDADVLISHEIQDDINAANEDAPQIVAVIDERPPSLRVDDDTKTKLWKPIGESNELASAVQSIKMTSGFKLNKVKSSNSGPIDKERYKKSNFSTDNSPTRVKVKREKDYQQKNSDYSPPRIVKLEDTSSPRHSPSRRTLDNFSLKKYEDLDSSPSRKRKNHNANSANMKEENIKNSTLRQTYKEDDNSPPRKHRKYEDSLTLTRKTDNTQSRKLAHDEDSSPLLEKDDDNSPPRKNKNYYSSPRNKNREQDFCKNKYQDIDNSPPRRKNRDEDNSPLRKKNRSVDRSPPRRQSKKGDDSLTRIRNREDDNSPRKNRRADDTNKKSRWGEWGPETSPERSKSERMKKTLDGKTAGLQNAKELVQETALLRQRENEIFKNMSAEVSGVNAATIVRGRKERDFEEEAQQKKKEQEMKEKYDRWGKGLKQVEDKNEQWADQLHEMNKPLARYADDEDLEKYLKEQEREGDPMLAYIRKKKKKNLVSVGIPDKPVYMGEFMPNRFGIRPGYRWDGVDRSNGYEKKWFQVQNSKKASQEEAFKWSTEDM